MSHIVDILISYFDTVSNILTDVFHSAGIAISIKRHFFSTLSYIRGMAKMSGLLDLIYLSE